MCWWHLAYCLQEEEEREEKNQWERKKNKRERRGRRERRVGKRWREKRGKEDGSGAYRQSIVMAASSGSGLREKMGRQR